MMDRIKHNKRGSTYSVLGDASAQVSWGDATGPRKIMTRHLRDGDVVRVYRSEEEPEKLFVRFPDEFTQDRFTQIEPGVDPKDALWALAQKFISDQKIHCGETVYQSDRVIENGYEFIHEACKIVGFFKDSEDEGEE